MGKLRKGNYVLATKYTDGDPRDQWCVGFIDRVDDHYSCTGRRDRRYIVVDSDGRSFRAGGFRCAQRIGDKVGRFLVENRDLIEVSVKSLWWWKKEARWRTAIGAVDMSKCQPCRQRCDKKPKEEVESMGRFVTIFDENSQRPVAVALDAIVSIKDTGGGYRNITLVGERCIKSRDTVPELLKALALADKPETEKVSVPMPEQDPDILRFFEHGHLHPDLALVCHPFKELAHQVWKRYKRRKGDPGASCSIAETMTALRKLLEAKDAAVRAVI